MIPFIMLSNFSSYFDQNIVATLYIDKNVMVVEYIYSLPYPNNMLASKNKITKRVVTLQEISQQTGTS